MQPRTVRLIEKLIYAAVILGALWVISRYLLKWLAPFIPAFFIAALIEPPVRRLCGIGWRRRLASAVMTAVILSLFAGVCIAAASASVSQLSRLFGELPSLAEKAESSVARIKLLVDTLSESSDGILGKYVAQTVEAAADDIAALPELVSRKLLGIVANAAQAGPDVLLFAATAGIGTFFISASYPETLSFLSYQLPDKTLRRISDLTRHLKASLGGWLRAQAILMLITFFELLAVFLILRVRSAGLLAGITAVIDALPVFGTGVILLPWAVFSMLSGETSRAIGLAVSWGVISIVRSCIQAKLLGDQIGLAPLASLLSIYVGWRVCGVFGMIVFPLLLVLLQRLNDSGVITLWKSA